MGRVNVELQHVGPIRRHSERSFYGDGLASCRPATVRQQNIATQRCDSHRLR